MAFGTPEVFPARAGMILGFDGLYVDPARIPRESGDDPLLDIQDADQLRYSPRERG